MESARVASRSCCAWMPNWETRRKMSRSKSARDCATSRRVTSRCDSATATRASVPPQSSPGVGVLILARAARLGEEARELRLQHVVLGGAPLLVAPARHGEQRVGAGALLLAIAEVGLGREQVEEVVDRRARDVLEVLDVPLPGLGELPGLD